MLFGEWLENNVEDLNNPNFIKEVKEQQKEDPSGLELTIILSGHTKLMEWWVQYREDVANG